MLINSFVAYCCNLVHKDHNVCFKHFSGVSKVSDVAKPENSHYLLTRNHHIDNTGVFNHSANDFSSSLTKPYSQQRADFYNSILEYNRLSFLFLALLLFQFLKTQFSQLYFFDSIQRINGHFLDSLHHLIQR